MSARLLPSGSVKNAICSSESSARWTTCGPSRNGTPRPASSRCAVLDREVEHPARPELLRLGHTKVELDAVTLEERHRLSRHAEQDRDREDGGEDPAGRRTPVPLRGFWPMAPTPPNPTSHLPRSTPNDTRGSDPGDEQPD